MHRMSPCVPIVFEGIQVSSGGSFGVTFEQLPHVLRDFPGIQCGGGSFLDADHRQQPSGLQNPINEALYDIRWHHALVELQEPFQLIDNKFALVHYDIAALRMQMGLVKPMLRIERERQVSNGLIELLAAGARGVAETGP